MMTQLIPFKNLAATSNCTLNQHRAKKLDGLKPYSTTAKFNGLYQNLTHYHEWRNVSVDPTKLEAYDTDDPNIRCVNLHLIGKLEFSIKRLTTSRQFFANSTNPAKVLQDLEWDIQIKAKDIYKELHIEDPNDQTKVLNTVKKIFSHYRKNRILYENNCADNVQPSSELSQTLISNSSDAKQFIEAYERANLALNSDSARTIILQECNEKLTKKIGYPAYSVVEHDRSLFFTHDFPFLFDLSTLYPFLSLIISFLVLHKNFYHYSYKSFFSVVYEQFIKKKWL